MKQGLRFSVLITTMNQGIERVKNELLPQLKSADEIIISHQITDVNISPERQSLGMSVHYFYMYEKGLSKNRNTALSHATGDICYICDDDLCILPGFVETIKKSYEENVQADVITFQAVDEEGNKHFHVTEGKHSRFSILRVWSWGITFRRISVQKRNLTFNEQFGLGAQWPVGEENIFLSDCIKSGCQLYHLDTPIIKHPRESSSMIYSQALIEGRIHLWKQMLGFPGALFALFYFLIFHYKFYKRDFSILNFFILSCKGFGKDGE